MLFFIIVGIVFVMVVILKIIDLIVDVKEWLEVKV